jgi:hypothetical protein
MATAAVSCSFAVWLCSKLASIGRCLRSIVGNSTTVDSHEQTEQKNKQETNVVVSPVININLDEKDFENHYDKETLEIIKKLLILQQTQSAALINLYNNKLKNIDCPNCPNCKLNNNDSFKSVEENEK